MELADLPERTGWTLHHLEETASTNDVALDLVASGAAARTVVVAECQQRGRGREQRPFASPRGGLYASLLLLARPQDLPARVVGLVAVAAAEAIERVAGVAVGIKWPNDLWIGGRKVGGILLELLAPERPVVAGLGVNLRGVPKDLPDDLRPQLTALDVEAGRPVSRAALLAALLSAVDRWQAQPTPALAAAWRGRLALVGARIVCTCAGARLEGVLEDADLERGLLVRDALSGPVWRPAEHVQDLRAAERTIS